MWAESERTLRLEICRAQLQRVIRKRLGNAFGRWWEVLEERARDAAEAAEHKKTELQEAHIAERFAARATRRLAKLALGTWRLVALEQRTQSQSLTRLLAQGLRLVVARYYAGWTAHCQRRRAARARLRALGILVLRCASHHAFSLWRRAAWSRRAAGGVSVAIAWSQSEEEAWSRRAAGHEAHAEALRGSLDDVREAEAAAGVLGVTLGRRLARADEVGARVESV